MEKIKLIALDLDGTILTNDKRLTDRTRDVLNAATASGTEVVFITGRPFYGLPEEIMDINNIHYIVTSNGAITTDMVNGTNIRTAFLDDEVADKIVRIPLELNMLYNVFIDGYGYSNQRVYDEILSHFDNTALAEYVMKSRRVENDITNLIFHPEKGVENIWIRAKDKAARDHAHDLVLQYPNLQTVLTADTDIEVTAPHANKGIALENIAAKLGIAREHVLAIGDNDNDLDMLKAAGVSVAMGNANDFVKSQALLVADTNENDGAAKMIEKYLF